MPRSKPYDKPKQFRRASEAIAQSLKDIELGRSDGSYPVLDAILEQRRKTGHHGPDSVCTPDCPNRQKPELIRDVRPPTGERLAVLEHMAMDIKEKFDDHKQTSMRFASKEGLIDTNARIDHEIIPALDKLSSRSTLKTAALIFSIIGLLVSMAYNVINLYKTFHT